MTLPEIQSAVQSGHRVFWGNERYEVFHDAATGDWRIKCDNGHIIGLTWQDGVTLNGRPEQFYKVEAGHVPPRQ